MCTSRPDLTVQRERFTECINRGDSLRPNSSYLIRNGLPDPSISDNEVVFTKYGNHYFLHEVLCGAVSMHVALPASQP